MNQKQHFQISGVFEVELNCSCEMKSSAVLAHLERGTSSTISKYVVLRTFGTQIRATVHVPTAGEYRLVLYGERRAAPTNANARGSLRFSYLLVVGEGLDFGTGSTTRNSGIGSPRAMPLTAHEARCYGTTEKMERCGMRPIGVSASDPFIRTKDAECTLRFGYERPLAVLYSLAYYAESPACKLERKEYVASHLLRNDKQVCYLYI